MTRIRNLQNPFLFLLFLLTLTSPQTTSVSAFDCSGLYLKPPGKGSKEQHYDLTALGGERIASKTTETPPTSNEAKVKMSICGDEGVPRDSSVADEDQCPAGTKICLTLTNHKSSSNENQRVTAVIPLWPGDLPDHDITVEARENTEGLDMTIEGGEYAGSPQSVEIEFLCSPMSKDENPTFNSYSNGVLSLSWSTPEACPRALDGSEDVPAGGGTEGGKKRSGIGGFFKLMFWVVMVGLILYFVVGIYHNYTTYGSKGLDLLPHKDFWLDLPTMLRDLFSHLATNLRGGNSGGTSRRSGYTSLG